MTGESAYLVHPLPKNTRQERSLDDVIEEAEGLARAISLTVIGRRVAPYTTINAGSYLGKGTRADIAADVAARKPSVVIVNAALSPVQQRNLEKEWQVKVIDRTGLILEIFGARAQTKEGRLQVELAALEYQRSRLVRSWTHLERQRGGAGFMGGPGERQIELDKRVITNRITKLKRELEDVRRTRTLGRKSRERVPYPVISLVGYTNAGKSTLFNALTAANVFAEDLPFATLDPTMRKITLPNRQEAILADTVGFIADLPTHLIAAFRATLEQIGQSHVIVHVIDVSRPDHKAQKSDVIKILQELGIAYDEDERIIEVMNKIDRCEPPIAASEKVNDARKVYLSAVTGEGVEALREKLSALTSRAHEQARFTLPHEAGKALSWLYEHGEIVTRTDSDNGIIIEAKLSAADVQRLAALFPEVQKGS